MEALYRLLQELNFPKAVAGLATIYYGCEQVDWSLSPEMLALAIQGAVQSPVREILLRDRVDLLRLAFRRRHHGCRGLRNLEPRSIAAYRFLRRHQISKSRIDIYRFGSLDLIRKYGTEPTKSDIRGLCGWNTSEVIDYVFRKYNLEFDRPCLNGACGHNTIAVIDYLATKIPVSQHKSRGLLVNACRSNSLEVIRHLLTKYDVTLDDTHLKVAIVSNSVAVVKCLMEEVKLQAGDLTGVYRPRSREVLEYLVQHQGSILTSQHLTEACKSTCNVETIDYIVQTTKIKPTSHNLEQACEYNTTFVVQHLIETYELKPTAEHLAAALRRCLRPHTAKLLIRNYDLELTPEQSKLLGKIERRYRQICYHF